MRREDVPRVWESAADEKQNWREERTELQIKDENVRKVFFLFYLPLPPWEKRTFMLWLRAASPGAPSPLPSVTQPDVDFVVGGFHEMLVMRWMCRLPSSCLAAVRVIVCDNRCCVASLLFHLACCLSAVGGASFVVIKSLITFAVCHKHATLAVRRLTPPALTLPQMQLGGVEEERRPRCAFVVAGRFPLHAQRGSRQQGHDERGVESAADLELLECFILWETSWINQLSLSLKCSNARIITMFLTHLNSNEVFLG